MTDNSQSLVPPQLLPRLFPGLIGVGTTADRAGVEGINQGHGSGVLGEASNGIGVLGRGGRLAGKFEGDVEITGKLSVAGLDVQTTIQSLMDRINSLEQRVDQLENPPTAPKPPARPPGHHGKGPV